MQKLTTFFLSSVLLLGAAACSDTAQTSPDAPDTTARVGEAPGTNEAQNIHNDGTSELRRRQLESDIRAREQRSAWFGEDATRADSDLESEIRSKLEANLPASQLTVDSEKGVVTISGTVPTQPQLDRVEH